LRAGAGFVDEVQIVQGHGRLLGDLFWGSGLVPVISEYRLTIRGNG